MTHAAPPSASMTRPHSPRAAAAYTLVKGLQERFRRALETVSEARGAPAPFDHTTWLRDEGRHGGGDRYFITDGDVLNRAAINVSQVHYDDLPEKKLASATALSTIIHPHDPRAPSVHMHFSFTERRNAEGYWRLMADLNPAIVESAETQQYASTLADALKAAAPDHFASACEQGDAYFAIPALNRTRGVFHFYLEAHRGDAGFEADAAFTQAVAEAAIDAYGSVVHDATARAKPPSEAELQAQLAYHTAYLFQVLTLDRGTTAGLMVHDQNDAGIMGSLPEYVDRDLLASWRARMSAPQDTLVSALVTALGGPPGDAKVRVDAPARERLAAAVRAHYRAHPEAMAMQAAGKIAVPTVQNHA